MAKISLLKTLVPVIGMADMASQTQAGKDYLQKLEENPTNFLVGGAVGGYVLSDAGIELGVA